MAKNSKVLPFLGPPPNLLITSSHICMTYTSPPPKLSRVSPFRPAWRGLPRWLGSCSAFTWADGAAAGADADADRRTQAGRADADRYSIFDASRARCTYWTAYRPIRALWSYPHRITDTTVPKDCIVKHVRQNWVIRLGRSQVAYIRELHAVRLPEKFAPCSPRAGHPGRPVPAPEREKNWQAVCPVAGTPTGQIRPSPDRPDRPERTGPLPFRELRAVGEQLGSWRVKRWP